MRSQTADASRRMARHRPPETPWRVPKAATQVGRAGHRGLWRRPEVVNSSSDATTPPRCWLWPYPGAEWAETVSSALEAVGGLRKIGAMPRTAAERQVAEILDKAKASLSEE